MKPPFDAHALEQIDSPSATAAAYFSHFRSTNATTQDYIAFEYWLARDEAHRTAWEKVERLWDGIGHMGSSPEIMAMRKSSLAKRKPPRAQWAKPALAAAVALFAIMGGGLIYTQQQDIVTAAEETRTISTGIGQQASFRMVDGSLITVNTGSRLMVAETGHNRAVHMDQGEALFEVEKDAKRPFTVETGGLKVTALGTAFAVRNIRDGNIDVTLVHGKVRVDLPSSGQNSARSVTLEPGMALQWNKGDLQLSHVNTDNSLSWRKGMLNFDRISLADAVAEVNRYSQHKIVLADSALTKQRVSGSFRIGAPRGFLQSLEAAGISRIAKETTSTTELVAP